MRAGLWLLCLAILLMGCSGVESSAGRRRTSVLRQHDARSGEVLRDDTETARASSSAGIRSAPGERVDTFEALLRNAGLEEQDDRPIPGNTLTPAQAARLLATLLRKPVTLGTFPSRMVVGHLLREVIERGPVAPAELQRRVGRFRQIAVLRPDGCLAWALTGRAQQRIGEVAWEDGAFRAHHFELGRFYVSNGFVFRLADERLEPIDSAVFVEVYDDADYLGRALDGAESAFLKLALSVGQLLTHPLDSLAELKNLPSGVAALITASPAYFERFRHMTRGEQVRAAAELATNLLVTAGTASATTRSVTGALAGAEAHAPVLSLSAQGALRVERLAVPIGRAATVVGGGPGAAIVLHRVNSATMQPSGGPGPGQWGPAKESMSPRARRYQEQISGHSADEAYWVGGVKFDGFEQGVLLEAKGPGYANKFLDDLKPKVWFEGSGAKALVDQANRQRAVARGAPIRWHIAEERTTEAIRKLFDANDVEGIEVIFTPPLP
ncbi:Tox-REase-5 domain-containing protein [Myxococcus faecalis]|uniref:Tox-REase-5 domain-containing protein n=1 Tax=Myxococcus faecalis TaxID=3115646 RepID=UPI0038CF869A